MNKIFLFAILALTLTFSSFAQTAEEDPKPCKEDRQTLCKDVKPGQGRIIKCLKENEAKLSPACKTHLEEKTAEAKENHNKCKEDRKKFCKDVKPGEGRIIKCLKDNEAQLSADCKAVIAEKK